MKLNKPLRGSALFYIIAIAVLSNAFIGVLLYLVNTYVIYNILRIALVAVDIYYIYYILMDLTLEYIIDDESIQIKAFWGLRKIEIYYKDIKGYTLYKGNIHGIKLSGIGNDKFAYGRSIIDKIGTTHMFVASNKNVIYLKTSNISYGISPKVADFIEEKLIKEDIQNYIEEFSENKNIELHKDKKFFIPFIIISILIVILTLNPFILYLRHKLPDSMPLIFDTYFKPIQSGTGKQFAFKQMTYGVLNMIILFCMYYASYFCAKYDKKTAYRYIYVSLLIVLIFLFFQIKILVTFN